MAPGAGGVLPTLRRAASAQSTGLRRMAPHQDHAKWKSKARIESDTAAIAYQTGATVISNYAVISWLGKTGVKNTRPQNPDGTYSSDFGRAKCANAVHSSSLPDGTYGGSAGGFVVESADANFYYSGSE